MSIENNIDYRPNAEIQRRQPCRAETCLRCLAAMHVRFGADGLEEVCWLSLLCRFSERGRGGALWVAPLVRHGVRLADTLCLDGVLGSARNTVVRGL